MVRVGGDRGAPHLGSRDSAIVQRRRRPSIFAVSNLDQAQSASAVVGLESAPAHSPLRLPMPNVSPVNLYFPTQEPSSPDDTRMLLAQQVGDVGIWEWDISTGRVWWSDQNYRLFGVDVGEPVTHDVFVSCLHPDDVTSIIADTRKVLDGALPYETEFRVVHPDGAVRWILARAKVEHDAHGLPRRIVGVNFDLTERRVRELSQCEMQERLCLAVETEDLGLWDWNITTGEVWSSERLQTMLGYEPGEMRSHIQSWEKLIHPDDKGEVLRGLAASLEGRATAWSQDCRLRAKDGSWPWVAIHGRVREHDGNGAPVRAVGTIANVTDRKSREAQREVLVGELNHRLKNTFAIVQALANLTARFAESVPDYQQRFSQRLATVARMQNLRMDRNHGTDLRQLLRSELEVYDDAGVKRVELEGPDLVLPARVSVSIALMAHELTTNAIKHGSLSVPEGRVSVTWSIERTTGSDRLQLAWTEAGGPCVGPPKRKGFGSMLIQRALTDETGGDIRVEYDPEGLRLLLSMPLQGATG
ncbi:sensor histidine kinase [Microvirga sp. Mcv34]|uniref:sensor histidine kinase n=1 Tax=Microvirga sp. Mcv34 TaxID=2926016 RepID=UPI0021C7A033|nr:PAS domain-containing protein [Microvirga sp. Mcv34]